MPTFRSCHGRESSRKPPNDYVLPFSHDHELAHPGYYSVEFDDGIKAELTVAARGDRAILLSRGDSPDSHLQGLERHER
jgi:hypothetical protein